MHQRRHGRREGGRCAEVDNTVVSRPSSGRWSRHHGRIVRPLRSRPQCRTRHRSSTCAACRAGLRSARAVVERPSAAVLPARRPASAPSHRAYGGGRWGYPNLLRAALVGRSNGSKSALNRPARRRRHRLADLALRRGQGAVVGAGGRGARLKHPRADRPSHAHLRAAGRLSPIYSGWAWAWAGGGGP